jgi:hypothetical protein
MGVRGAGTRHLHPAQPVPMIAPAGNLNGVVRRAIAVSWCRG